ncbi:helix-turn-helix domain-containing protein [Streptomyces sp. NPDC088354]|uniref:helix-turn-helix domain-containing protein n=1 Tax=unclassified Streptomyces TaxID=2593676 RepID=UPI0029BA56CF|nr:pyridoxamine 5'-phosphate oxidase family protein [Streptomyces sp. MI02-7b]MDX3077799.1 pyridoxamine 5'-phosphate oxidase family protein [Streptomyces sp. MI02-7b]
MSENRIPSHAPIGTPKPEPGEVARRVTQRCAMLGISREEVARRAGMSPHYLKLLQEAGADFDPAGLLRIAAALRTTPGELLGGAADQPPGQGPTASHPVLQKLGPEECRDRLGTHGIGRVAMATSEGPVVLPVNYTVLAGSIVYRTDPDAVTAAAPGTEVAFEVDHVDEAMSSGWSILTVGRAEHVDDPGVVRQLSEQAATAPWAGGKRDLWVRINPTRVTGRVIRTA